MTADQKYEKLKGILQNIGSAAIAFSGGVDSTLLLQAAVETLGAQKVLALTANSPIHPGYEVEQSRTLAAALQAQHLVVNTHEMSNPDFSRNDPRRCYFCKKELLSTLLAKARSCGFENLLDGSNADDLSDYRPGWEAVKELGLRSPLMEAGLEKSEIRALSHKKNLPTWDKPSFACLSSRIPYWSEITTEKLAMVERCETFLRKQNFRCYRVRHHGETARIEVSTNDFGRLLDETMRRSILAEFRKAGFTYVALDLEGYRSGSLNVAILKK